MKVHSITDKLVLILLVCSSPLLFIRGCETYYSIADAEAMKHSFTIEYRSRTNEEIQKSILNWASKDTIICGKKLTIDTLNGIIIINGFSVIRELFLFSRSYMGCVFSHAKYNLTISIRADKLLFIFTDVLPKQSNENDAGYDQIGSDSEEVNNEAHKVFKKLVYNFKYFLKYNKTE